MIIETGKCPTKMRLLAMLILRELSPTVGYSIQMSAISADINWLPLLFPLIFAQVIIYRLFYSNVNALQMYKFFNLTF